MAVDTNLVVNPTLYPDLSYAPFRNFTPISVLTKTALVLVANPKVTADNVSELIAYAKANPRQLNYASIGLGKRRMWRHDRHASCRPVFYVLQVDGEKTTWPASHRTGSGDGSAPAAGTQIDNWHVGKPPER